MKGFVDIPLIIVLVLVLVGGFFAYKYGIKGEATFSFETMPSITPSPTLSPAPSPTPNLTPKPTVKAIPKVVVSPTPTIAPSFTPTSTPVATQLPGAPKTGCALYDPGGDLGSLKVIIQPESDKQIVGDTGVTINRKYPECQGVDPGFPVIQIIHQGETLTTFSGMRPGPFHIEVNYHGDSDGYDVDIHSGDNSTTVTVHD